MDFLNGLLDFVSHAVGLLGFVFACAAACLACDDHKKLDDARKKLDYIADKLYEVEGIGDVPAEREKSH